MTRAQRLALLGLFVATAAVADPPPPAISVGPLQRAAAGEAPGSAAFTVEVATPGGGTPRRFVVRGPDKLMQEGERPTTAVVGERLLVQTQAVIAVFDLATRQPLVQVVAAPSAVATPDGRRVAWREAQLPFTPAAASGSVIQVLDVPTLAVAPVFPEREAIEPGQTGNLLTWEDEPARRHTAGPLAWSPDGTRLAFFCTHGGLGGAPHEVYLTVVDLRPGLAHSRFVHRPFDWQAFLERGPVPPGRTPFFAVAHLAWTADDALVVEPPPSAGWREPRIVVPLADIERELSADRKEGT